MSFVEEIINSMNQALSLIKGYRELVLEKGQGLIDFVTYLFTKCLPAEFQGFILFLLFLLLIRGFLRYIQ